MPEVQGEITLLNRDPGQGYYVVSFPEQEQMDLRLLERHLPEDGSVIFNPEMHGKILAYAWYHVALVIACVLCVGCSLGAMMKS